MKLSYTVKDNTYKTVREVIRAYFNISDRLLAKIKKQHKINLIRTDIKCDNVLDNNIHFSDFNIMDGILNIGDIVEITIDFEEDNSNIVPTKMDLNIIYEDDCYIIINKPAGIPVHPSMDHYEDSLSNGLKYYFDNIGLKKKIRPVNRIDKNTSGLIIFAKNEYIQECLIRQMKEGNFYKEYIAICEGKFNSTFGTINKPIARKENSIIERCVDINGDTAITHYEVLKYNLEKDYTVLKCVLETGRTHQIRVHLSYIGHPLLGDTLYGNESRLISRQALHSYKVSFVHPIEKKLVSYVAPLPNDLNLLI